MQHLKLWINNRHDLNALSDSQFKDIEDELLEFFGGVRNLINITLIQKCNLNYMQLMKLSKILKDYKKSDEININKNSLSLTTMPNNALSNIFTFLSFKDQFYLQCVNSIFFNIATPAAGTVQSKYKDIDVTNFSKWTNHEVDACYAFWSGGSIDCWDEPQIIKRDLTLPSDHIQCEKSEDIYIDHDSKLYTTKLLISGYAPKYQKLPNNVIDLSVKYYLSQNTKIIGYIAPLAHDQSKLDGLRFNVFDYKNNSILRYRNMYNKYDPFYGGRGQIKCTCSNIRLPKTIINNCKNDLISANCEFDAFFFQHKYSKWNDEWEDKYDCFIFNDYFSFQLKLPSLASQNITFNSSYKKSLYSEKYGFLMMDCMDLCSFSLNDWKWRWYKNINSDTRAGVVMCDIDKLFTTHTTNNKKRCLPCLIYNLNEISVSYTTNPTKHIHLNPAICCDYNVNKKVYIYTTKTKNSGKFNVGECYDMIKDQWCGLSLTSLHSDAIIWLDDINKNILYACSAKSNFIKRLDVRTNRWNKVNNDLKSWFDDDIQRLLKL